MSYQDLHHDNQRRLDKLQKKLNKKIKVTKQVVLSEEKRKEITTKILAEILKAEKKDEFSCHMMSSGTLSQKTIKGFSRDLEDLMRKYKIIHTTSSILAKLD